MSFSGRLAKFVSVKNSEYFNLKFEYFPIPLNIDLLFRRLIEYQNGKGHDHIK